MPLSLVAYHTRMACVAARPNAMLQHFPARLLAYSLQRKGAALCRAHKFVTAVAAQQQPTPQAAPGVAAVVAQLPQHLTLVAANPAATQLLAHFFACELHPSDCYLLYGSVGAGKSYFSRAFIRAAADDEDLPVPSPTFLLQNIYTDHEGPPIHHFDLYRLTERYDLARLDLAASFSQAVCLVEWAERLALLGGGSSNGSSSSTSDSSGGGSNGAQLLPRDALAVHISILEGEEQAALQQRLGRQQQQQQRWQQDEGQQQASSSSSSDEEEDEADEDASGDHRWRRIQLAPAGSGTRWQPRLQLLRRYLAAEGAQLGCFLLEGEAEGGSSQEGEQGQEGQDGGASSSYGSGSGMLG